MGWFGNLGKKAKQYRQNYEKGQAMRQERQLESLKRQTAVAKQQAALAKERAAVAKYRMQGGGGSNLQAALFGTPQKITTAKVIRRRKRRKAATRGRRVIMIR